MTQVWAPRQASRIDRRVRLEDRLGRVAQRAAPGLVGADLVAGGAVRVEGEGHGGRSPVAVVAVGVALPLADLALQLLLERVRRVRQAEDRERHLDAGRRAPGVLELGREDGLRLRARCRRRRACAGARASGSGVGSGVAAGLASGSIEPLGVACGTGVAVGSGASDSSSSSSGSVTRTVLGAGGPAAGPARNRSTRASRWSNRSPTPKALTATAPRADGEAEEHDHRRSGDELRAAAGSTEHAWAVLRGLPSYGQKDEAGVAGETPRPPGRCVRSRLQVERPDVAWPEDRDRTAVERRDPADAQALGRGDQQGVGQARPVLGGGLEVLGRAAQVGVGRGDEPDPAAGDRPDQRERRVEAELPLEQRRRARPGSGRPAAAARRRAGTRRSPASWLRSAWSAAASTALAVEQDRHVGRSARDGPAPPASRRAIERPSSDSRPCWLRPTARKGRSGASSCRLEVRLDGGRDDRRPGRPVTRREPPDALEQVRRRRGSWSVALSYADIYDTVA